MTVTRRHFLLASAAAAAHAVSDASPMHAMVVALPAHARRRGTSPVSWLPDPPPVEQLRALAAVAMETARSAGAEAADIRIGVQRRVTVYGSPTGPWVGMAIGYGVRAWHAGTWSFQHGNVFTVDAVAATARGAVDAARRYAAINAQLMQPHASRSIRVRPEEWAPAPVVTGTWRMPVEIDPFLVSIDDYQRVIDAAMVRPTTASVWRRMMAPALGYVMSWRAETRVFASMTGSLVTQDTMCGGLGIEAVATSRPAQGENILLHAPDMQEQCGGFELALRSDIPDHIQQLRDAAVRWRELPWRPFRDVGRFPIVLDGRTMAALVGATISTALDGDRVSRLEVDASGGSFLTPPEEILSADTPYFSPALTLHVHRSLPSPMAVRWDDDGVASEPYTVVDRGHVVDFHTTRETAPMLSVWYARQGRPLRSHGNAVAPTPVSVPMGSGGQVVVASGTATSVEALTRDLTHGFLVINGGIGTDPGLTAGVVIPKMDGVIVEIRRGIPVSRTPLRLQFATRSLLGANLVGLADVTTRQDAEVVWSKGIPWQTITHRVSAPAALFRDVDVVYA